MTTKDTEPFDHTKHGMFNHPSTRKPLRKLNPYEAAGRIHQMFKPQEQTEGRTDAKPETEDVDAIARILYLNQPKF